MISRESLITATRDRIERLIVDSALQPGDQLPAESDLTAQLGVARTTVREAFKLLEQDGRVNVVHGRGRFLSEMSSLISGRPITKFESVTEMMASLGYSVENSVLSVEESPATEEEAAALRIDEGAVVVRLERLRLHDGETYIYSRNVFPRGLVRRPLSDVDWGGSLIELLRSAGAEPVASVAQVRAALIPDSVAVKVGPRGRDPWLLVIETCVAADGRVVLFASDYHRADVFSFHALRRREDGRRSDESSLGLRVNL